MGFHSFSLEVTVPRSIVAKKLQVAFFLLAAASAQAQAPATPRGNAARGAPPQVLVNSPVASTESKSAAGATTQASDYRIGPGDMLKIAVFQQPDLTLESRVSDSGRISFPLLGSLALGGLTSDQAERLIARGLEDGGYLRNPQVAIQVSQFRSQQVSVLGNVNRPGRYPIDLQTMRLSEVLALAGGVSEGGGDTVVVTTIIEGTPKRIEVDLTEIFLYGKLDRDLALRPGDAVYVDKAPVFYVYGQVQRPGMYPLERGMTLAQALAKGGGLTLRGTDRGLKVHRREASGDIRANDVRLDEAVRPADLIMVRESLF